MNSEMNGKNGCNGRNGYNGRNGQPDDEAPATEERVYDGDEQMEFVWIEDVRAAFETLLDVVDRECDTDTRRIVYWVMVDVMAILAGEWEGEGDDDHLQ